MTSGWTDRRTLISPGRGPLWRRSAFRSVMERLARFRFARSLFGARAAAPRGGLLRNGICEAGDGFRANIEGEGQDADDQPADRKSARGAEVAQKGAGAAAVAAEARR